MNIIHAVLFATGAAVWLYAIATFFLWSLRVWGF